MPAPDQFTLIRSHFHIPAALAALLLAAMGHPTLGQATDASSLSSQITTIETTVRRVNVDVIVTDSQGRPVSGLTREDFKVEEDNAPQPIRTFQAYTVDAETSHVAPKIPPLPPNTFLNIAKAPEGGTPTVVLYDALNTPLSEWGRGQQEMLKFLNRLRPVAPVAVVVLSDGPHLVQGFNHELSAADRQRAL
jgi:VWFA-related protein